ncbi:SixA phosphatase family protein [Tsukamurella paurometabola]|uniref:Putative phosphohistidine phosphatase, SixA n=1 Tax=Tsukamurella paurometabola (strain ATCC 8368 / DSM 20162 / CCUG 35730 / CIP 100753 / JCM 10117 / KCTC 9821 / NBRC 16120 / NCIMB 702349 / NCTC 13040) TaxID=521096 RepID=D5UTR3_TSUPD|nr:histidine phosphatase family protein [Tsukamurella paurometabola]ADG77417.1 putative phosphohistidine phosphatase, SixA [Tsukamurella paurometabola DSM 20162]SUP26963.1 Phosphohistidine phosphatase sixA [Tsukamurella paurometabola]
MTVLALMRHGEAAMSVPDGARPITPTGHDQALHSANWLRGQGLVPDQALVSAARRTVETFRATGFACAMSATEALYECRGQDVLDEVNGVPGDIAVLLVVGHFPGLPEAVSLLDPTAEPTGFEPGTVVLLDLDDGPVTPGSGRLRGAFTP